MTQKAKYNESIKVNLDEETYRKIQKRAQNHGFSKSAVCRSIIKQEVEA